MKAAAHYRLSALAASVVAAFSAFPAHALDPTALPTGGQISAGNATISQQGARMDVNQASARAVINWSSFNIGSSALVNFAQPSSSSIVLNRVTTAGGASDIQGRMTANGQVFLLNPNGVLFGRTAQVDVGGLVATSLGLSDTNFLSGRYNLSNAGGAGSVVNQGTLRAVDGGYIALLAPEVRNEGVISARLGTAALAAGDRVTLDFAGDRLISLAVDEAAMNALVENRRMIQADGGTVLLAARSAGDLAATVVNNTGLIQAASISEKNGVIRLEGGERGVVALSGALDASGRNGGESGGTIKVLGDKVGVFNGATLDASGDAGGGTVLVGGNFQGKGPERNATATYVAEGAQIKADALTAGNGGKVIVWADDVTRYYGSIFARGGAQAGDGGAVEVSGKGRLVYAGSVNALAAYGNAGSLLLDPTNIEVVTGGTAILTQVDQFADADISAGCVVAPCSKIAPATINAAAANVTLQATNNILFTNAISMTNPGVGLAATATNGTITVNAPITTANRATTGTTGAVTLTATNGAIVLNSNITTGDATVADAAAAQVPASGSITLSAGTNVTGSGRLITGNASVTGADLAGADTATSGSINVTAGSAGVSGGIGLSSAGNALTIGTATRSGAVADTATSGNVVLSSRDEINNGTVSTALGVIHGTATGATTNVGGTIRATTTTAAGNVFLNVTGPLKFGASSVAGNLSASSSGTLFQSAALTVTGTSTFNANANAITLNSAANNFIGAVSFTNTGGANNVAITDANALTLGAGSTGGTLTVAATGALTQTAPLTVAGATSLQAGAANSITLSDAGNALSGQVRIVSANNVTLNNNAAFAFGNGGTSAVSGNLSLTANGAVTQANALTVTGTSSVNAGANAITLTNAANNFTGAVSLANSGANAIQVTDVNAIVLGTVSTANNLTVTGVGITQNAGGITVGGTSSLNAGAGVLTLTTATNDFTGAVSASNSGANAMQISDQNAIQLGTINTGNNLTVIASGAITQAAPLTVAGTTSLTAGAGNDITLSDAGNALTGQVRIVSGNNVTLNNNLAFAFGNGGASAVSGDLSLTANGAVTQAQALTVAGTTSVNAGANAITLTNAANNFTGPVSVSNSGANAVSITDLNAIQLGTVSTANNLTVVAAGAITQSAALTVGGTTSLAAGAANDITLSDASNALTGQVRIVSGNNVTLNNNLAFAFGNGGASAVSGNLSLTAAGAVTQAQALTVAGTTSVNAGANPITLTTATNNFTGAVSLSNTGANAIQVTDTNAIQLGTVSTSNNLTVTGIGITQNAGGITVGGTSSFAAGAGVLTLNTATNDFTGAVSATNSGANAMQITDANAIVLGTINTANNLTVNAVGITQSAGALTIGGTSSFNAGAGAIALTTATNNFTGAVSASTSGANTIQLTDVNAIQLGTVNTANNLTVTGVGITQNAGGITVGGTSTFAAGAGVLTLNTATNDFIGAVSATNSGPSAMQITDANAIQLGTVSTANNFTLAASGAVTQSGPLTVTGTSSLAAGAANDITLSNAGNALTGQVRIVSGNNVTLNNNMAFAFGNGGASAVSGDLSLTANGAVTQAQALTVAGTSSVNAGASAITLTNAANNFTGPVSLNNSGANNVAIRDTNTLVLGASNVGSGTLGVTAGGAITQTGAITQAAAAGTTTFTLTGAGSDVQLNTQANNFSGAIAFGGTLGNVHDFGLRNTNAGATVPTLSTLTNLHNLTLQYDNAAIALPAFTTTSGGSASVIAGGAITQGGAAVVAGAASFSTGSFPITLTNAANNFTGPVSLANTGANAIQVRDVNSIQLGTVSTSNSLTVTGVGITQNAGGITVGGTSTFNAGAGALTLTTATNDFTGPVSVTNTGANAVQITDTNAIQLGTISIGNDLTVTGVGITQNAGGLTVPGTATFNAGAGPITLTTATNNFTGAVSLNNSGANNVAVTDVNGIVLGTSSVGTGTLAVTASGANTITQTGAITQASGAGAASFATGAGAITLTNAANNFTGPVSLNNSGANNVSVTDTNALILGASNIGTGTFGVTAGGSITQTGAITQAAGAGTATFTVAPAGSDILLNTQANNFSGAIAFGGTLGNVHDFGLRNTNAGATVPTLSTLTNLHNLTLQYDNAAIALPAFTTTSGGSASLIAGGAITQGGAAVVAGNSSFGTGAFPITLTNAANNFGGAVSLSNTGANNVSVVDVDALTLAASTIGRNLSAVAGAGLTVSGTLTAGGTTGTSIELAGQSFTNTAGAAALAPGAGSRFLVWSSNANPFGGGTPDNRGGLAYDFKQYSATFGVTTPAQATGNGFLYSLAPTATPGLTGSVSKTYDGATTAALAAGNYTVSGAVDGDTITLNNPASGTYDTRNVGTGKNVSVSGLAMSGASNGAAAVYGYQLSATTANANIGEISQRGITVTAQADTKTYDGSTGSAATPTITSGSLAPFGGDTASFTQTFDTRNAGTSKTLTATGSVADGNAGNNYAVTFATNSGVINQRAITVTAQADTKTYDGSTSSAGTPAITSGSLAPFGADSENFTQSFDTRNAGTSKILSATGSVTDGNGGNNYAVTFATNSTGVINQRAITVTAQADTKTYDGSTLSAAVPVVTIGSIVVGDTGSFTQAFDTRNAGAGKTLTATGLVTDGNGGNNYAVSFATNGAGVVNRRAITITAQTDMKTYDGSTASGAIPTITAGSLAPLSGDSASFTQTFDTQNAGAGKTLSATGSVTDGNSGNNYAVTFATNNTGVINQRAITVTAQADSKTYDGSTGSIVVPAITAGSLAPFGGDAANFAQSFDTRNAGSGKTLTATGSVIDGNSGNNYAVTFATSSAGVINQRQVTVTAQADTKTYDGSTISAATPVVTAGSIVAGDTGSFTQTFDTRNAGTGKTLTATGSVTDGNAGNNYAIAFAPAATGVITPRPITVSAAGDTKVYDATTTSTGAPTVTAGSLVGADTGTFSQTYDTKNAGTGKTLTATGTINDGNSGNNYVITFAPNTTGVITTAALAVAAEDKTRPENTPNPAFTASFTGLQPGDSALSLGGTLVFATPATAASPAGLYPITPSGVTSSNYAIRFVDGVLTVTAGAASPPATPPTTPPANDITITGATAAIASTVTPPVARTTAAAPSSGEVLNTLAPTAGGIGEESSVEQISPRISIVNCGIQSPTQGCGPR